jgi:hypothetical protein
MTACVMVLPPSPLTPAPSVAQARGAKPIKPAEIYRTGIELSIFRLQTRIGEAIRKTSWDIGGYVAVDCNRARLFDNYSNKDRLNPSTHAV